MRLTYKSADRAARTSSTISGRARGSPPVKSACNTPACAASRKTRDHSCVESSASRLCNSSGFEQYTQCSGQRWVSSATRASGVGKLVIAKWAHLGKGEPRLKIDGALLVQERQVSEQILRDALRLRFGIQLVEVLRNLLNCVLAVATLHDFEAGSIQSQRALRHQ